MSKKRKQYARNKIGKHKPGIKSPLKTCQELTELYLLAVFGFFPLITGTGAYGYENIIQAKAWVWLALTAIWALVIGGYLLWCMVKKIPTGIHFGWIQWTATGFLFVNLLSACFSEFPAKSFLQIDGSNTNSLLFIASYVIAFLGMSLFGSFQRMHIWALAISSTLSGILSLGQLAGHNPLNMYPDGLNYYNKYKEYTGAFLGTIGNVDYLAAFLCLVIPMLTVFAFRSRNRRDRFLLLPALLSLYVLYAIDVDAGKVGLMGCIVLSVPAVIRDRRIAVRACAGSAALVLLGLVGVYFWPGSSGYLWEASQILHGHVEPSFGHDRVIVWMEAWKYIREHPLLGTGPGSGTWIYHSIRNVNSEMQRITVPYNTHNVYLGFLVESGIFALAGYLTLIGKALAGWIRKREDDVSVALGAGIVCYLIQDFFNLGVVTAAPLCWIGLGMLAGSSVSSKTSAAGA